MVYRRLVPETLPRELSDRREATVSCIVDGPRGTGRILAKLSGCKIDSERTILSDLQDSINAALQ